MLSQQEFERLATITGVSVDEIKLQYHICQKDAYMALLDETKPDSWETAFDTSERESDVVFRSVLGNLLGGKCPTK